MLGAQWRRRMQQRRVRLASGLIVLGFGLLGLMRAANGLPASWLDAVCITHVSDVAHATDVATGAQP
jgi:hypothetical protein